MADDAVNLGKQAHLQPPRSRLGLMPDLSDFADVGNFSSSRLSLCADHSEGWAGVSIEPAGILGNRS